MAQIELEGRKCTNGMGVKRHKLNEGGGGNSTSGIRGKGTFGTRWKL